METHLHEWAHLTLRWIHFIVGVAWIGASFYFNWLENNLQRNHRDDNDDDDDDNDSDNNDNAKQDAAIAGRLWAIHGGGFYHLTKYKNAPPQPPQPLHWFKWEAYTTWLSGAALLTLVYYVNARAFLLRADSPIGEWQAIAIGALTLPLAWLAYDALCRSPLRRAPTALAACIFALLTALAAGLGEVFGARAAYIHVGAAIGTMMVGNVFFVIIPAQKEIVAALNEQRRPQRALGAAGLLRSRHNNYLTLPALFTMISAHFPSAYSNAHGWAVLAALSLAGVATRHYFNVRKKSRHAGWLLAVAAMIMIATAYLTAPRVDARVNAQVNAQVNSQVTAQLDAHTAAAPTTAQIAPIIYARCTTCHARTPSQPGFAAPPVGLILETIDDIERADARIYTTAGAGNSMPLGNLTGMTDAERARLIRWYNTRRNNSTN